MSKQNFLEIKHLKGNTYYFAAHTNIGIYKLGESEVCLIDTGDCEETVEAFVEALEERDWTPVLIVNTHGHPDHTAGNSRIAEKYNCPIYADERMEIMLKHPKFLADINFGSSAPHIFRTSYYMAPRSETTSSAELPEGFQTFDQEGHAFGMMGIITPDNIAFIGDGINSRGALKKHKMFYNFDFEETFRSFERLRNVHADVYIPSHGRPVREHSDLVEIIDLNIENCRNNMDYIYNALKSPRSFETLLSYIIETYQPIRIQEMYFVIQVTLKGYLSYMIDHGMVDLFIKDNVLHYVQIKK